MPTNQGTSSAQPTPPEVKIFIIAVIAIIIIIASQSCSPKFVTAEFEEIHIVEQVDPCSYLGFYYKCDAFDVYQQMVLVNFPDSLQEDQRYFIPKAYIVEVEPLIPTK